MRARSVTLAEKARVQGTVDARVLVVKEGAWLSGSVAAGEGASKASPAPARPAPAPAPRRQGGRVKLRELAERLGCELRGDGGVEVEGVAGIEQAGPGDVTFLANPRYASHLATTRAAAVILAPGHEAPLPCLVSDNPYLAFARAVALLRPPARPAPGVHPSAQVDPTAVLGADVHVGALAVVGRGVRVGARTDAPPAGGALRGRRGGRGLRAPLRGAGARAAAGSGTGWWCRTGPSSAATASASPATRRAATTSSPRSASW